MSHRLRAYLGAWTQASETTQTGLGLVIYTQGIRRRVRKAKNPKQDLFAPSTFLDHCRKLGAGGMQIPLGVLEPAACQQLRETAASYGMFIEGIVGPPFSDGDVARFRAEIETASRVGALAVRTVIIPGRRYERFRSREEFDEFVQRGRQALERARPIVEQHQVRLAVENHKDQRLDKRLALLKGLNSPFIGACVDTGNSLAPLEDPLTVVEALAPYAFTVHLKDQAVQEYGDGFLLADVALGDGCLELRRMVDILRRASRRPNLISKRSLVIRCACPASPRATGPPSVTFLPEISRRRSVWSAHTLRIKCPRSARCHWMSKSPLSARRSSRRLTMPARNYTSDTSVTQMLYARTFLAARHA